MRKKRVFASGSLQNRKDMQRKVNKEIYKAKCQYKDKVQSTLSMGNSRAAWTGIKLMANAPSKTDDKASFALANNLNEHFTRFEKNDSDNVSTWQQIMIDDAGLEVKNHR